jgi:hypothetical protein
MLSDADALLRLALVPGLTRSDRASACLTPAHHPGEVFGWSMDRLQSIAGIGGDLARRICDLPR